MTILSIEELIKTYPRTRPPLSEAMQLIYKDQYKQNRSGKGFINWLCQLLESWMHWKTIQSTRGGDTLELGAGTLNHIKYELIKKHHTKYDIVEPSSYFYTDSKYKADVSNFYNDIIEIPAGTKYDRIISIAVLEHMTDLPDTLKHCTKLLHKEGIFQACIPSEGGALWGISWRLTKGLSFRIHTGLNYKEMMLHEHVNSAKEVIALLSYYFRDIKIKKFPFPWHHLSLYCYIEAKNSISHD